MPTHRRAALDMANDPDRYAALDTDRDWNMGPFYVLVDANTGEVVGDGERGVSLYRRVGPHFFTNAKSANRIVRRAIIRLIGPEVTS